MDQWLFTYIIIGLLIANSAYLIFLGNYWGAAYWFGAAFVSVCAMHGLTK